MAKKFLNGVDLSNQKIVNLADGSAVNDAATYGQLQAAINAGGSAGSQISITTTADNSGISWALSDSEDPSNGTSPQTPLSVGDTTTKELDFPTNGTTAQLHVVHAWVGTAGAKTIGRSTNMAQGHAYAAIEILSA